MKHRHTWLYPSAGNRSACCLPSASSTAQAAITYRKLAARRAVPLLSIILALLLAISAALLVGAVNAPNGYVDDASGVIDSDTCEYIRSRSDALCKLTGAQIVIAITRSLNGEPIDRYAERYFLDREIGDKNKDNGVLLLMAIDDGNYWLTKGSGLESTLPVSSLRTMLDSIFEPCFAAGEYSVGTKALFDALYGKLCALYGVNPSPASGSSAMISGSTDTQTEAQGSERGILPYMLLAIIAAAIVTVVIFLVRAMRTPAEDTGTENLDGSSIAPRDTSAAGTANFVGAAKSISQSAGAAERTDKRSVGAVGRGKENGNTRTVLVSDESTRRDSSPRSAIRASSALASLGSSTSQAKASAAPAAAYARTTAPAAEKAVSAPAMAETQTPEELQRILLARRRASSAGNARTAQSNGAAQSRQVSASDITVPRRAPSVQPAQTARSGQASRGIQNTTPVQRRSARTAPPSQGQAVRAETIRTAPAAARGTVCLSQRPRLRREPNTQRRQKKIKPSAESMHYALQFA